MAEYKGTIAGIGEIIYNEDGSINESSTNVIYPEFDATIRNFIVGKNCILEGLEIDNGVLTAGYCQAKGFVGHLPNNITLTYPNGYICAVFKVYKDDHTLDEFYIEEFSDAPSSVPQQDILHGTGTFYLPLYYKGGTNLTRNYPEHSVYSDHANIVSSRLEKGVVGYTHEVTTDDDKVATCKFVHDVIKNEINYKITTLPIFITGVGTECGTLTLEKKAGYVICTAQTQQQELHLIRTVELQSNIPSEFLPLETEKLYIPFLNLGGDVMGSGNFDYSFIETFDVKTDGTVTHNEDELRSPSTEYMQKDSLKRVSGWKTKI